MRLRPRSIRVRDTLIAAVLAALVLGAVAAGVDVLLRNAIKEHLLRETQLAARRISAGIRDGTLPSPIPEDASGVKLIQVVDARGRVINSTLAARGRPAMSTMRPPPRDRVRDVVECSSADDGCLFLEAIRVSTSQDSVVVYAAQSRPGFLGNGLLEAGLGVIVLALTALAASITWRMVGRTLRPVEQIRAQLVEISGSDLSRRVSQPPGEDEIALLARTANETLDRLQRSVDRQRQFASDASHELRTPITGLRANLEDAAMHPDDTDLVETIHAALRDTDRLESIVTDLLLLARLGTGGAIAREPIELADLVKSGLSVRTSQMMTRTDLAADLVVQGVRVQLLRLLHNLLDNADRFADGVVEIELVRDDDAALLTVTDDGIGIAPADRERVFERFTRLDSARSRFTGGTGLGLAIARDIAVAHGGSLRIEDSPAGARFALRLPLVAESGS